MRTRRRVLRPLPRLLAALLVVGSILPLTVGAPTVAWAVDETAVTDAVEADDAVRRARDQREQARRQRDAVARRLDEAAAAYEQAWSQAERLAAEAGALTAAQTERERLFEAERRTAGDRAVAAYLSPSRQVSLAQLVLGAHDAGSALHLAGLISHVGRRSDRVIAEVDDDERRTRDETRQQQVVTAGAHAAARLREDEADRMQAVLDDAVAVVTTAERTVARAEEDAAARERARQREEAERRRREEAARLAAVRAEEAAARAESSGPPPAVNGRVCPIGEPNGFIDSWGFPRSGGRSHKGVDIFAPRGTAQYAVADGRVDTGSNRLGGLTVWLTDTAGNRYYYAHLESLSVADGAAVRAGDVVGTTGTSGNAVGTPPHLHWQYHPGGGAAVNPYPLARALCR